MTDRFDIEALHAPAQPRPLPVGDGAAIVILALFILFVISVPKFDLAGVIAFAAFPLLLATATAIPLLPLVKRLVIASPFILFMAAGNLALDRSTAVTIGGLAITGGTVSASVIVLKTVVTLAALLSLMAVMPFHRFGMALRSLRVPEVFVTQLLLVYRYSFLLAEEAGMMQKARDLRSFGKRGKGPLVTAKLIGSLLIRTTARAERIYMAMSARSFRAALGTRPNIAIKPGDLAAIAGAAALFGLIRSFF
ncbi:energy-coupling factor transporter transmembrane protein EcfT [Chlorobaculum sp. MV4-Y]|uniref:energy-coupling factor transporter transmembrane component T n=1 Tax=Chlorobaculum sp. MV4-Y TaxID=2976335 RepID=UPI0021AEE7C2|nr:energy-coupling factor transporter transmembrane component T [Chlorobaculum sp. MV4-Y]UWX58052.1 energy-coupling factor transporter transmembrane protein EcfT [Chlorobaculum sp. MV4-Y]